VTIGQHIIAKTLLAGKDSAGVSPDAAMRKRRKSPNPRRKLTDLARCIRMKPSCTRAVDVWRRRSVARLRPSGKFRRIEQIGDVR
jgi:hypothetical protein